MGATTLPPPSATMTAAAETDSSSGASSAAATPARRPPARKPPAIAAATRGRGRGRRPSGGGANCETVAAGVDVAVRGGKLYSAHQSRVDVCVDAPPTWRDTAVAAYRQLRVAHPRRTAFSMAEITRRIDDGWAAISWSHQYHAQWRGVARSEIRNGLGKGRSCFVAAGAPGEDMWAMRESDEVDESLPVAERYRALVPPLGVEAGTLALLPPPSLRGGRGKRKLGDSASVKEKGELPGKRRREEPADAPADSASDAAVHPKLRAKREHGRAVSLKLRKDMRAAGGIGGDDDDDDDDVGDIGDTRRGAVGSPVTSELGGGGSALAELARVGLAPSRVGRRDEGATVEALRGFAASEEFRAFVTRAAGVADEGLRNTFLDDKLANYISAAYAAAPDAAGLTAARRAVAALVTFSPTLSGSLPYSEAALVGWEREL